MAMPRSKHRRKKGGKAIKRPGHGKPPREMPLPADTIAFMRFGEIYRVPFHAAWPDHQAGYMVDLVSDAGFDFVTRTFHPIPRDKLLRTSWSRLRRRTEAPLPSPCGLSRWRGVRGIGDG